MSARQYSLFDLDPKNVNIGNLEKILSGAHGWLTASEILSKWGLPQIEWRKRFVRALAEKSEWIISGQRGYKHIANATAEELHHAAAWLESQAKKMADRASLYRRQAHRLWG